MAKKITCFTDSLVHGGAQRQLVGLAVLLKDMGYDVNVLLYHDIPFYKHILDEKQIESVVVKSSFIGLRMWKLYKYLYHIDPDVVIAYQTSPSIIACILRPLLKWDKLIVSERNTTQYTTLREKILHKLWHFTDYIVTNSYAQRKYIQESVPNFYDRTYTITNFVDSSMFSPVEIAKDNSRLTILSVGRITSQKNILKYIEAVHDVYEAGYDIKVLWVGDTDDDEYESQCRRLLESYGLIGVFDFLPAQRDVVALYNKADVFCLPSIYEGFPNVVCEAMGCGLPVLCSDVCDNPLIVKHGFNGFLFSPNDKDAISKTISDFIKLSLGERRLMGLNSRKIAVQKFSKSAFVKKYIELIES